LARTARLAPTARGLLGRLANGNKAGRQWLPLPPSARLADHHRDIGSPILAAAEEKASHVERPTVRVGEPERARSAPHHELGIPLDDGAQPLRPCVAAVADANLSRLGHSALQLLGPMLVGQLNRTQ